MEKRQRSHSDHRSSDRRDSNDDRYRSSSSRNDSRGNGDGSRDRERGHYERRSDDSYDDHDERELRRDAKRLDNVERDDRDDDDDDDRRRRRRRRKRSRRDEREDEGRSGRSRRRRSDSDDDDDGDSMESDEEHRRRRSRRRKKREEKRRSRRRQKEEKRGRRQRRRSDESSSDSDSDSSQDEEERRQRDQEREQTLKNSLGYTNDSNPFGDSNLTQKFVWKKKMNQLSKEERAAEKRKSENMQQEVLELRQRRLDRERERQEWEEEKERLMREQELQNMEGWEQKEEEFHLKQAKLRSEIRIREGRAKPIDLVANNLKILDPDFGKPSDDIMEDLMRGGDDSVVRASDFDIEIREPYNVFDGLTVRDMEELQQDIGMYLELDHANRTFWLAMETVCQYELNELRARQHQIEAHGGDASIVVSSVRPMQSTDPGIHSAVKKKIAHVFVGKSHEELTKMQQEIEKTLENPDGGVDTEYWDSLLKELKIHKTKALLRKVHMRVLDKYLTLLREETMAEGTVAQEEQDDNITEGDELERKQHLIQRFKRSNTSRTDTPKERQHEIERADEEGGADDALMRRVTGRHLNIEDEDDLDDEDVFADEVQLFGQEYSWNDKYRPRKPRSFNRILTGYEWSRYNSVHYDKDNPPPKVVQGYRFNIFYPDLIDKSKPPTFFVEKDGASRDTAILRFHAGPPYEDIAFRIVNREWEKNHRRGYRCVWDRGILQLHFRFRRYRYRR